MNRITPTQKVWRYFEQKKAVHLIETNQLYLRRLDLLTDDFEGNPTLSLLDGDFRAESDTFGFSDEASIKKRYECERKAIFVSCWQMSECESWHMWKLYCQNGGGFAIQTSVKQLSSLADKSSPSLLFRDVTYEDYWSAKPVEHRVPMQAFIKPPWFWAEREIRLALFRSEFVCGTENEIELKLTKLPDHELVPVDLAILVEEIILNPFGCQCQKKEIVDLIRSLRPELKPRLRESAIAQEPPLLTKNRYF